MCHNLAFSPISSLTLRLARFPSVFHEWFLENFPEPSSWHRARLGYSRTAAVISMVGFVLGCVHHTNLLMVDSADALM